MAATHHARSAGQLMNSQIHFSMLAFLLRVTLGLGMTFPTCRCYYQWKFQFRKQSRGA